MIVHVFVGPSCPEPLLTEKYPDLIQHGPARHGDLFSPEIRDGDTAVIVDGIYHHRLALRHKEILDAMARGVTVIGAASIGALRAAELAPMGMTGVGLVHQWYRDGVFDGDDAVSVAHGETGSPVGVNVPLVNLYAALLAGRAAGVLAERAAGALLDLLEQEYYPLRTPERVRSIISGSGESAFGQWYAARLGEDPDAFDQKRADTLAALDVAVSIRRADAAHLTPADGDRDWRTEYHRRWRSGFAADAQAPGLQHRLAYRQVFDAEFPATWWNYLQESFLRDRPDSPDGLYGEVVRRLGPAAGEWMDDPKLRGRITSLVLPVPDLSDRRQVRLLLDGQSAADRETAAAWLDLGRRYLEQHRERSLLGISESTCRGLLSEIWKISQADLPVECGRRGFSSVKQAAKALRPFAVGYRSGIQMESRGHVLA